MDHIDLITYRLCLGCLMFYEISLSFQTTTNEISCFHAQMCLCRCVQSNSFECCRPFTAKFTGLPGPRPCTGALGKTLVFKETISKPLDLQVVWVPLQTTFRWKSRNGRSPNSMFISARSVPFSFPFVVLDQHFLDAFVSFWAAPECNHGNVWCTRCT
jgi:hypothetical protein